MHALHYSLPAPPKAPLVAEKADDWCRRVHGEPALRDLLDDPIVQLLMRRDGVSQAFLEAVIKRARAGLWRTLCRDKRQAA